MFVTPPVHLHLAGNADTQSHDILQCGHEHQIIPAASTELLIAISLPRYHSNLTSTFTMPSISSIISSHRPNLSPYEDLYKHFHANPELSNQEKGTAAAIASHLSKISSDYDIRTGIGGHGLAALLTNGSGRTILLRADFDALPVEERTGLPYASKKRMIDADGKEKPVMHACGHDMHITALLAAAETLAACRESWAGTLILAFQPAEERGTGAQAM